MAVLVALMSTVGMDVAAATRKPVDASWFAPAPAPSHTNNNYTLDLKWIVSLAERGRQNWLMDAKNLNSYSPLAFLNIELSTPQLSSRSPSISLLVDM